MNRSKYIFLIFAFVYMGIALCGIFSVLEINENVLLGLSLSSLLISLADIVRNYCRNKALRNEYDFALSVASDYLQHRIDEGNISVGNFDVCNIKYGIDMLKSCPNPIHPVEYNKKKMFEIGRTVSTLFFVTGIASFIILPFIKIGTENVVARFITLIAFALMCWNIYLNDLESEIIHNKYLFDCDKQSLISSLFPNYKNEFLFQTQHLEAFTKAKEKNKSDYTN